MSGKLKEMWGLNSPLLSFLKKIGWVFLVNILFLVTSIPIVTVGASSVAMYTVFYKLIEEREFGFFKDYFKAFGKKIMQATVLWLIMLLLTIVLAIDCVYVFGGMTGASALVMRVAVILVAMFFVACANTVFPLIARFDLSVREVFVSIAHMLWEHPGLAAESVAFSVAVFGGMAAILYTGYFGGLFVLFPFIAVGLHAFMQSYLYRQLFSYYEPEDE